MIFLGGCAPGMTGNGAPRSTLTDTTYRAAEMLMQQSRTVITQETPIQIGTLDDMDRVGEQTPLGRIIAGQIGARFVQLGYNVTTSSFANSDMRAQRGISAMDAVPPPAVEGHRGVGAAFSSIKSAAGSVTGGHGIGPAEISGQYALARSEIMVNLRIIETGTSRVLAAYDYSVPLNDDVRELLKTSDQKKSSWLSF